MDKKKCIVIYGLKEETEPVRYKRERERKKKVAEDIVRNIQREGENRISEIERIHILGKYIERPLKVKFRAQTTAMEVISNTWKLDKTEQYSKVWIKRDMNEEERLKVNNLIKKQRQKMRTEQRKRKKKFSWNVKDERLRKWYLTRKRIENVNNVWKNKKWTVVYTNIICLISTLRELNNYIKIKQHDIMAITEVKLNETTKNIRIGNSNYNVDKK